MVWAAKLGSGPASVLYDFRKPKPGHRGPRRLLQAIGGSVSLQVPLSRRGGGWGQPGMLVAQNLQPPVLRHLQLSLFYSLALLSLKASLEGMGGGFFLRGRGREHQHWHCQLPKDQPCREAHHSCTTSRAAPAPAMVGNSPCQRQPPLSLASSASRGAELSLVLGSWVPVSPHPAWLARDAVKSRGCPLLITHVGAEAFIVGKALLAHSVPLAAHEGRALGARLCYLPSSREPHDSQPAYLKSNANRTGSLASPQGKVPFAATRGTGFSREGQILIALLLVM